MSAIDFFDLRRKTLKQLRCASDAVRTETEPQTRDDSMLSHYLASNQSYFRDDVLTGQLVQADTAARVVAIDHTQEAYYTTTVDDLGRLRTGRGNVSGFEVLHPAFLEPLVGRFFSILDDQKVFKTEEQFLHWLAVADFTLQLLHPVKDGTGRSGEDLLAILGTRCGYPLTFSITGYRAALDTLNRDLFHRHVTERVGFIEFVRLIFQSSDMPSESVTPWQIVDVIKHLRAHHGGDESSQLAWPGDLSAEIEERAAPALQYNPNHDELLEDGHPYRLYAAFMVREITYLLLCLEDADHLFAGLLDRYPLSMGCRVQDLKHARLNQYIEIPASSSFIADDVMARIDLLRLGKLAGGDADLSEGLCKIKAWNGELGSLIERESQSQSMEKLLQRLRVPQGWTLSPREFRDAIDRTMDWRL